MPPWAAQLFSEMCSLRAIMDDHIAIFEEKRGRWDADQSMLAHLTTMINLIQEGMAIREKTLDEILAELWFCYFTCFIWFSMAFVSFKLG
jgi:hypothetical protein